MRTITLIIIHCTATPEGREHSAKDIDKWHRQRGFKMIGYHYLIRLDGTIERGRPEEMVGAHCAGHNAHSIGVCYVGGTRPPSDSPQGGRDGKGENNEKADMIPADTRTPEQKASMLRLLRELKDRYPGALIVGHNTLAHKACPCFDAAKEYMELSESRGS